ncbi:hypothetical protein Pelo_15352 [Pelomyxa schiedti]|nr:hypothetical protein Pelo_15352 [Pelomyxa schiedti]
MQPYSCASGLEAVTESEAPSTITSADLKDFIVNELGPFCGKQRSHVTRLMYEVIDVWEKTQALDLSQDSAWNDLDHVIERFMESAQLDTASLSLP